MGWLYSYSAWNAPSLNYGTTAVVPFGKGLPRAHHKAIEP